MVRTNNAILVDTIKVLSETRDTTIRLEERMKSIDEKLSFLPCVSHDKRIRDMENRWLKIVGASAVIVFIIQFIINNAGKAIRMIGG